MNQWISREAFQQIVGVEKEQTARAWLALGKCKTGKFKGQKLITRKVKSERGHPAHEVLWDTETNQPATGDNHVISGTGKSDSRRAKEHQSSERVTENSERHDLLRSAGYGDKTNRTDGRKNEQQNNVVGIRTPELNQPATGDDHATKNNKSTVQVTKSDSTSAPTALSFKQLAKTAEKNAQERDNQRMDAVLDKILGESNVVSYLPSHHAVERAQSVVALKITEPTTHYESESRLAEQDSVLVAEAQAAGMVNQNLDVNDWVVDESTGELAYPVGFDCQIDYVLELIAQKTTTKTISQAANYKNDVLKKYYQSLDFSPVQAQWQTLSQRLEPAKQNFVKQKQREGVLSCGVIPEKVKANNAKKKLCGRKSTIKPEYLGYLKEFLKERTTSGHKFYIDRTERTTELYIYYLSLRFCPAEIARNVTKDKLYNAISRDPELHKYYNNLPGEQSKDGKVSDKGLGHWAEMPVCKLWLMDGVVPQKLAIRGKDSKPTHICIIGVQDYGSRMILNAEEFYSENAENTVSVTRGIFAKNDIKKGESDKKIIVVLRPDQGSGFNSACPGTAYEISRICNNKHRFNLIYKAAAPGEPTAKASLESFWRNIKTYVVKVKSHFERKFGKDSQKIRTVRIFHSKTQRFVNSMFIDITLEELRETGILEQFRNDINNKKREFIENGLDVKFRPMDRWLKFLNGGGHHDPLPPNPFNYPRESVFRLPYEETESLLMYGFAKQKGNVRPHKGGLFTVQAKESYIVEASYSHFSTTKMTPILYSKPLGEDGKPTGELYIFEDKSDEKDPENIGSLFLCKATQAPKGAKNQDGEIKYEKAKETIAKKQKATVIKIEQDEWLDDIVKELGVIKRIEEPEIRVLTALKGYGLDAFLAKKWIAEMVEQDSDINMDDFCSYARRRLMNVITMPKIGRG